MNRSSSRVFAVVCLWPILSIGAWWTGLDSSGGGSSLGGMFVGGRALAEETPRGNAASKASAGGGETKSGKAQSGKISGDNFSVGGDLEDAVLERFADYCFDCHGYGEAEGGLSFESLTAGDYGEDSIRKWEAIWDNVRAETMPPASHGERPSHETRQAWLRWINGDVFGLSEDRIDPGQVTLRRLNRSEYAATIVDLTDVRIDAAEWLPPDDTGFGFDTVGSTLMLSPVLLERYIEVAGHIVDQIIPAGGPGPPKAELNGWQWRRDTPQGKTASKSKSIAEPQRMWHQVETPVGGRYELNLRFSLDHGWVRTPQTATLKIYRFDEDAIDRKADRNSLEKLMDASEPVDTVSIAYNEHKPFAATYPMDLEKGSHWIALRVDPLQRSNEPIGSDEEPVDYGFWPHGTSFDGPMREEFRQYDKRAARILFNGPPPADADRKTLRRHAAEVIESFGSKAFRRPIDAETVEKLSEVAIEIASADTKRYEDGITAALKLILVSPRFLYRGEQPRPSASVRMIGPDVGSVPIDDYSLATRLSYFLWGTTPDSTLMELAAKGELRSQLDSQIDRLIETDWKLQQGVENFVGQWLKIRDVDQMQPNGNAILRTRDQKLINKTFNGGVKHSMKQETYEFFEHMIVEDRPLHEMLNADYTFLDERLANFYGIDGVKGREMRRVELPDDSHRRGVLTHASVLLVTSNPTRTSPVKRGLFVLENLLGVPGPPAPPDVPELTDSAEGELKTASLREVLAKHRENPACASCHSRMDPLGLALENYNAWGQYTDQTYPPRERWWESMKDDPLPIDSSGTLMTGESFENVEQLADILANQRRDDFYRCITTKWLTFTIGRGLTYRDTTAVDKIVRRLHETDGSTRTLIREIVGSVPFSNMRIEPKNVARR